MAELQTQLSNINFMSKERFDSLESIDDGQLYAVEFPFTDEDLVHTTGDEEINGVKTFNNEIYAPNQVDYTQITNCITEIPQDIKLELVDGTLTLKAGSKVYVPNGFEADGTTLRFDEVVVSSDLTYSQGYNDTRPLMVNAGVTAINGYTVAQTFSGSTAPTDSTYMFWYDTANNIIKETHDSGTTWSSTTYSFPICIITGGDGVVNSIDQVFNGMGYIGAHGFILPGVKCLIPNGRDTDGTLKNIEFTTTRVNVRQYQYAVVNMYWWLNKNGASDAFGANEFFISETEPSYTGRCEWYKPSDNLIRYRGSGSSNWTIYYGIILASSTGVVNGNITSFTSKLPFRAVDYNDAAKLDGDNTFTGTNTFTNTIQGTAYRALWGDLAEYYESDKEYPRGTLVQFGGSKEITVATDSVNAVITSDPGFILNTQQSFNTENSQAIALVGKVPVRVIGKVNKFDYLTLSNIPGVAQSFDTKSLTTNIVARVLEQKDSEEEGLVLCVVKFAL